MVKDMFTYHVFQSVRVRNVPTVFMEKMINCHYESFRAIHAKFDTLVPRVVVKHDFIHCG